MTNLNKLMITDNNIIKIEQKAFIKCTMLEIIELQNNMIDLREGQLFPSSPFQGLKQLKEINLGNNSITEVFEDFTLESLLLLNLSSNNISSLSTNDLNNIKVVTIDLTYNQIQEVDFEYDINETTEVLLDHNPIACDCRIHRFFKHLKHNNGKESKPNIHTKNLNCATPEKLAGIKVSELDPYDLTCPLDNENTKIKKCPEGCGCEIRPEDKHILLSCDSNFDPALLPAIGQNSSELTIINGNLTELPIVRMSENKTGYELVSHLIVSENQISSISVENLPPRLKYIDIRNNQFVTLNESVQYFLGNISSLKISLGGNPWQCDCEHKGFVAFVKELIRNGNMKDEADIKNTRCDGSGELVNDIDHSKLCRESENLIIMVLCIITAIMGLVIGGIAALYYKYQKQIKMWLYSHSLLLWFVTEEELDKVSKSLNFELRITFFLDLNLPTNTQLYFIT